MPLPFEGLKEIVAELAARPRNEKVCALILEAVPMMKEVEANTGQLPREMSANGGYFSSYAVKELGAYGVDAYMPPDKMNHAYKLSAAPRGRIPQGPSIADKMRRKLRTKQGRKRYGLRKELSEPVFGQIKQARGLRQFLVRGEEKVRSEWRLICKAQASH